MCPLQDLISKKGSLNGTPDANQLDFDWCASSTLFALAAPAGSTRDSNISASMANCQRLNNWRGRHSKEIELKNMVPKCVIFPVGQI